MSKTVKKGQNDPTPVILTISIAACITLALLLSVWPGFPLRNELYEMGILGYVIAFFGALAVALIGALTLRHTNKQIQTYSWKRDQALKDIERIYEPLYQEVSQIFKTTKTLELDYWPEANWNRIYSSFLGTKLRITDLNLCEILERVFYNASRYRECRQSAIKRVEQIVGEMLESYIDVNIQGDDRWVALSIGVETLGYDHKVLYRGFIMGESVGLWSEYTRGNQHALIQEAVDEMNNELYWGNKNINFQRMDAMLTEIYENVQKDSDINEYVLGFNDMNFWARRAITALERHILEPQLP